MNTSVWKMPQHIESNSKKNTSQGGFAGPDSRSSMAAVFSQNRAATISPDNIGHVFYIHNGMRYIPLKVSENMVGYKFGAFSMSKKRVNHKKKKATKSKK